MKPIFSFALTLQAYTNGHLKTLFQAKKRYFSFFRTESILRIKKSFIQLMMFMMIVLFVTQTAFRATFWGRVGGGKLTVFIKWQEAEEGLQIAYSKRRGDVPISTVEYRIQKLVNYWAV